EYGAIQCFRPADDFGAVRFHEHRTADRATDQRPGIRRGESAGAGARLRAGHGLAHQGAGTVTAVVWGTHSFAPPRHSWARVRLLGVETRLDAGDKSVRATGFFDRLASLRAGLSLLRRLLPRPS